MEKYNIAIQKIISFLVVEVGALHSELILTKGKLDAFLELYHADKLKDLDNAILKLESTRESFWKDYLERIAIDSDEVDTFLKDLLGK